MCATVLEGPTKSHHTPYATSMTKGVILLVALAFMKDGQKLDNTFSEKVHPCKLNQCLTDDKKYIN